MALGEVDYGLNGLIGGLTIFISFFNSVLAGANARFYAFAVGAARVAEDKDAALEDCRRWFNTALSIHLVVPFCLVLIGYPIGVYAIEHWLTIPAGRVASCIWVFRFTCISCFVGMLNVPFSAMYGAKQYIAELTIYSFTTSTLNVIMLYYMVTHPGVWLAKFAAWACFLSVIPQIIICIRACCIFQECRICFSYMWDRSRLRRIAWFSGWQMFGMFCSMLRTQGITIVINKFFGAAMNAAQAIGTTVQGHCNTLAGSMQGAFVPVITQACGAGDYDKMNKFVLRTSKFNVLLSAVFMLPLAIELPKVMEMWLKTPPAFAVGLCYCAMLYHLAGSFSVGHCCAIMATGRIVAYHIVLCSVNIFTIPAVVVAGLIWRNVFIMSFVVIVMEILNSAGRLYFARKIAHTSIRGWISQVLVPLLITIMICALIGYLPHFFMESSFIRVCTTTVCCEMVFLPFSWFLILNNEEREFVRERFLNRILSKIVHKTLK